MAGSSENSDPSRIAEVPGLYPHHMQHPFLLASDLVNIGPESSCSPMSSSDSFCDPSGTTPDFEGSSSSVPSSETIGLSTMDTGNAVPLKGGLPPGVVWSTHSSDAAISFQAAFLRCSAYSEVSRGKSVQTSVISGCSNAHVFGTGYASPLKGGSIPGAVDN